MQLPGSAERFFGQTKRSNGSTANCFAIAIRRST